MIGDTLSSQNTDTLSLLQQEQISPANFVSKKTINYTIFVHYIITEVFPA